jgi:hypothetical protein
MLGIAAEVKFTLTSKKSAIISSNVVSIWFVVVLENKCSLNKLTP